MIRDVRNLRRAALAAALATAVLALGARRIAAQDAPPEKAPEDTVFRALSDELARAKSLRMKDLDAPYHLCAYANDSDSFHVSAAFGSITGEGGGKSASTSVNVRVGSPELDNTNYQSWGFFGGIGAATPSEPDYDALRQALWLQFDSEYKGAAQAISKKRAYLKSNTVKELQPDFAPAKVTDVVLPRESLEVDHAQWADTVRAVSAVFKEYGFVQSCSAAFGTTVSHQYFVSTDPARHRFPNHVTSFDVTARTQCDDGMYVSASWERTTRLPGDLPSRDELVAIAHDVAKRLRALREAPTAEDYWGPVLFTGDAAAEFFVKTIADPLSHCRQELGDSGGGRLVDRMGRRIAARTVTVRDDPTQKEWQGQPLLGYFPVDDDGVLPQPITLIDGGFLRTHYMSRVPTKYEKQSNGHSRAGQGSMGNLFVDAAETMPVAQLEQKLLELASVEELDHGLVVEAMGGSGGGFSFSFGGESGVDLPTPTYCYMLYADGRRQVVRGASFLRASFRVLRDIVALGDDAHLTNLTQQGQYASVVAPSVLVSELELRRPREEFSKPPYTKRPDVE